MRHLLVIAVGFATACTAPPAEEGTFPEAMASPGKTQAPVPTEPARPELERGPEGELPSFKPFPYRNPQDLVAGCPHMNPQERPRGSNCHGIFPEQCGADLAQRHIGKAATPELRETIIGYSPGGDVRFILPDEAVIEDLRIGRLNLELDGNEIIQSADCY